MELKIKDEIMRNSRSNQRCAKRLLAICISLCLALVPSICSIAVACEGKAGPKVKVEPKMLNFKELNKNEEERLVLTYTNEGPGEWNADLTSFEDIKGPLTAWGRKFGEPPCVGKIAVKSKCTEIIVFKPLEEETEYKARVVTEEPSEDVVVEGKSK